jgi:hypothetical protein
MKFIFIQIFAAPRPFHSLRPKHSIRYYTFVLLSVVLTRYQVSRIVQLLLILIVHLIDTYSLN